jgi:hypothetical protein
LLNAGVVVDGIGEALDRFTREDEFNDNDDDNIDAALDCCNTGTSRGSTSAASSALYCLEGTEADVVPGSAANAFIGPRCFR